MIVVSDLRGGKDKGRPEEQPPVSALRQRARDAAEALHSDNSCRWFPLIDIFPVYNYLYDYFRGHREDARLRRLAQEALERLSDTAARLQEKAVNPLPPEWGQAKAALAEASEVFRLITQTW